MSFLIRAVGKLPLPRLRQLAWQRALIDRSFQHAIRKAKAKEGHDDEESLHNDWRFESAMIEEEENHVVTRTLIRQARKLRLSLPPHNNSDGTESGLWEDGQYFGGRHLSALGVMQLRKDIRDEIKAGHEAKAHWIAWLTALTGVLGAITGLVAVLHH